MMKRAVRVNSQLKSHKRFANAFRNYCELVDNARLYCTNAVGGPPRVNNSRIAQVIWFVNYLFTNWIVLIEFNWIENTADSVERWRQQFARWFGWNQVFDESGKFKRGRRFCIRTSLGAEPDIRARLSLERYRFVSFEGRPSTGVKNFNQENRELLRLWFFFF